MTTKLIGRKISKEETKKIELDILKNVLDFCSRHNLKVFAAYGTLLGAVRHKGFIPWDDDIDLFMPRKDYDYLLNHFSSNAFSLINNRVSKKYPFLFSKVFDKKTIVIEPNIKTKYSYAYGVYIDIFPLDISPTSDKAFAKLTNNLKWKFDILGIKYKKRLRRHNCVKTFLSNLAYIFLLLIPLSLIHDTIKRKVPKNSNSESEYISNFTIGTYIEKERYNVSDFSEMLIVPFENITIPIPCGYDRVLRTIYGDYMVLPPIEMRTGSHGLSAFEYEESLL